MQDEVQHVYPVHSLHIVVKHIMSFIVVNESFVDIFIGIQC